MSYSIHDETALRAQGSDALMGCMNIHSRAREHMQKFLLFPEIWEKIPPLHSLAWQEVKFSKEDRDTITENKGVYVFSVRMLGNMVPPSGYITYVGKASNLRRRFDQYLREKEFKGTSPRFHIAKMLNLWQNCINFIYATVEDTLDESLIEKTLINGIHPPYNRADFSGSYGKAIREAFQ